MTANVELGSPGDSIILECVAMASRIVDGDGSISNTSPPSSVGILKEELICQVSQALGVIENVCNMSSTIWVNKHQCKRIADRFTAIGDELKASGFDKGDFVCKQSLHGGGSSSKDLPAFDKLLAVLRRGEALILYFREWEGIISVVSRTDCRSGEFKEIHKELNTMEGFESTMQFQSALIMADAEKDMEEMSKKLEHAALNSEITHLDSFVASGGSSGLPSASSTGSSRWNNSSVEEQQFKNHPVSVSSHLSINPCDIQKIRKIGSGASAKVYEAIWLGCRCAVKRFLPTYSRNWVLELQQELNFLSKLRHPHIVRLMGLSVDSQQRCSIVMEWMEYSLRDLIDFQMRADRSNMEKDNDLAPVVPFEFSEALDIITKIALGVWFLHTKGVTHRDLKSPNVLVRYFGSSNRQIKIVDFGASRHVDSNIMHAVIGVGTGFWRAPEILPTQTVGNLSTPDLMAADVYSFAMTSYEVLTGKLPFQDELSTGQLRRNEYGKVMSGLRPELPGNLDDDLKGLINSCWDCDPSHRPNFEKICKQLVYIKSKKRAFPSNKSLEKPVWRSILLKKIQVPRKLIHTVHRMNQGKELSLSSSHKEINLDSLMRKDRLERSNSLLLLPEHLRIESSQLLKVRTVLQERYSKFYEATWLGSSVVVKKLLFRAGSSYREQRREVDIFIKLSRHPYIVQLVGLSVDSKQQFLIVMEMTSGSLRALIGSRIMKRELVSAKKEEGFVMPFDIHEAVLIIKKIALAMLFLHSNGVMHRSLTSVKVLVEERTGCIDVKLQGFGMSIHEHIADSSKIDTSDYLDVDRTSFWSAPEILPTRTADRSRKPNLKAADVYSFALICYEVLTGELPFKGHLRYEEYNRVISGDRPTLPSSLHPELKALMEQCWHGDPLKRPNFTEICEELKGIEKGLPNNLNLRE